MILEARSPDERWAIALESENGSVDAYLIDAEKIVVRASLHIFDQLAEPLDDEDEIWLIWSDDSKRAGAIVNGELWCLFDLTSERMMAAEEAEEIVPIPELRFAIGLEADEGVPFN